MIIGPALPSQGGKLKDLIVVEDQSYYLLSLYTNAVCYLAELESIIWPF